MQPHRLHVCFLDTLDARDTLCRYFSTYRWMRGLMESHDLVDPLPERFCLGEVRVPCRSDMHREMRFLQELELALFTCTAHSSLHVH
jgi:hypothetical protein